MPTVAPTKGDDAEEPEELTRRIASISELARGFGAAGSLLAEAPMLRWLGLPAAPGLSAIVSGGVMLAVTPTDVDLASAIEPYEFNDQRSSVRALKTLRSRIFKSEPAHRLS